MRTHLQAGGVDGPQPEVNPYPRPPVPIFDLGEIRERVENWKAHVVFAPLSQLDSQDPSNHLRHSAEDAERLSPLDFPTVKRRKSDVAKAMKRKRKASSDRDYTTSRYFRGDGLADRMSLEAQAVNGDAECVTPAPRSVARRSNAELSPHSRAGSPDEDRRTTRRLSPTPACITAPVPESIHQIAEVRQSHAAIVSLHLVATWPHLLGVFATLVPVTTSNIYPATLRSTDQAPSDSTCRGPVSLGLVTLPPTIPPLSTRPWICVTAALHTRTAHTITAGHPLSCHIAKR